MGEDRPFGFEPDDFDRMIRDAGEGLRDAVDWIGRFVATPGERTGGWGAVFEEFTRKPRTGPATAGEAGDGVWAIYSLDEAGGARVEEVYASELDALRAHQRNTDPSRRVRFLPYGIAVSVLDDSTDKPDKP